MADRSVDIRPHLASLVGQTIETYSRRPNAVLAVLDEFVVVATNKSPKGKLVPITEIQAAADMLYRDGCAVIAVSVVGYRSAFVGAFLATLPGARWGAGRTIVLEDRIP